MTNANKYTAEIKNANKEISDFFGFNLENVEITIAENRIEYEKLLGRKTANWEIGNYSPQEKNIKLLDPARWEKDAPMHSSEKFSSTIKHELAHAYTYHLSKNKALPKWLNEGLAGAISGQYKKAKENAKYFETNFCNKLDTPFNWNKRTDFGAYSTSYLFTKYLIDKYGFETIKKLIQASPVHYSYNRFDKTVRNVFNKNLAELEQEFLNNI